ncbi:MAG TPA: Gfo/Idh/MocA family oxidoreductase [Urbifossiella sp.]|jgi:predicted dehydrogenase|nr:Gfo/Idh/MocA family oxidoreductase [Urbifossiella sp.]
MIRFGILDFDTSHATAFTQRLNQVGTDREQFVEGGRIVVGCPGESALSPERIAGFTAEMRKYNVPLVDRPEDMIGRVDAMLIESVDGTVHLARARPFLERGIPCFVDKPFACSAADARAIIDLAARHKTFVFSSSSLRYAPEVVQYVAAPAKGKVLGCAVHCPAPLSPNPARNAGLYHYGIHGAEIVYTLMGPGCRRVTCVHDAGVDVVTGHWADGRVATLRGIRAGTADYGFVGFAEKGVQAVTVRTQFIYRELLKKIVETFEKKTPAVAPAETLEIMAFIEAANKSGANHGVIETIRV